MSMALNPFECPLDQLFERLNFLHGTTELLKSHLEDERNNTKQGQSAYGRGKQISMTVMVWDLTWQRGDKKEAAFPSGDFSVKTSQDYLSWIGTVLHQSIAWSASQGCEAFETFLYNLLAVYFHIRPERAKKDTLEKFEFKGKPAGYNRNSRDFWKLFVRYAYRNSFCLLRFLRTEIPSLGTVENSNNFLNVNLPKWFEILTEVRHATTHSQLVIKLDKMSQWTTKHKTLLARDFPGHDVSTGYQLQLDDSFGPLSMLAMYAYVVFRLLSKFVGFDSDLAEGWAARQKEQSWQT